MALIFPGQCSRQAEAARAKKSARLLNIPYRAANVIDLISTQTVMRRYDFPSTAAVRDFAARNGIEGGTGKRPSGRWCRDMGGA